MDLQFLGAATTVTGSQYLLTTARARILIDCGMFQGTPDETIRNRVPFAYEPPRVDALLLTHAHLDHCGLIPHLVAEGFAGPIYATAGTLELAALVLLDSGRLQEEFAKREMRWEHRHPDRAAASNHQAQTDYAAALDLAEAGEELAGSPATGRPGNHHTGEHVPTTVEPAGPQLARPTDTAGRAGQAPEVEPEPELEAPLYTERDARRSLRRFRPIRYDTEFEVAPGVHATFLDAGHILGSAIIRLRVQDGEGDPERVLVFSGDLGRPGSPILRDYTSVTEADYLLVESTYGGREHEPEAEAMRILAETVRLVAEHDGVLLVPAFAIGRTQDLIWSLDRLIDQGAIPLLPLYLDSPMASKATDIYRRHPEYFDAETTSLLRRGGTPLDYPKQIVTDDFQHSQAIARAPRPYMIVSANGMLTGGRVVGHLRDLIDDPSAVILFVGYQGEGTLGAHLQAGATTVKVEGAVREVRCKIRSISGFSAHADESEVLDWLRNFTAGGSGAPARPSRAPRTVFIVHGDPEAQKAIEPKIRALGLATHIPEWHERVTLE